MNGERRAGASAGERWAYQRYQRYGVAVDARESTQNSARSRSSPDQPPVTSFAETNKDGEFSLQD